MVSVMEPTVEHDIVAQGNSSTESPLAPEADTTSDHVEDELLVEEISIDGMCGVY